MAIFLKNITDVTQSESYSKYVRKEYRPFPYNFYVSEHHLIVSPMELTNALF